MYKDLPAVKEEVLSSEATLGDYKERPDFVWANSREKVQNAHQVYNDEVYGCRETQGDSGKKWG